MLARRIRQEFRMARYIRRLFKLRSETDKTNIWVCVLRGRKLAVVRSFDVWLTDGVVMHRFLAPGEVPSWSLTYSTVKKRWGQLVRADIESPKAAAPLNCVCPHSNVECDKSIVTGFEPGKRFQLKKQN